MPKNHWLVLFVSVSTDTIEHMFDIVDRSEAAPSGPADWSSGQPVLMLLEPHASPQPPVWSDPPVWLDAVDSLEPFPLDGLPGWLEWPDAFEPPDWVEPVESFAPSEDVSRLPAGLATMEPGPALAAILASLSDEDLSASDRIVVMAAHQRMVSYHQAAMYSEMSGVLAVYRTYERDDDPMADEMAAEGASTEVRAALRLTRRHAESEIWYATRLCDLPLLAEALASGALDVRRVRVIIDAVEGLSDTAAEWVLDQIVDRAARMTTGQLRHRLARLRIDADPEAVQARYDATVADRRVVVDVSDSGTADIVGVGLPLDRVAEATDRIDRIARSLRVGPETRSMDQLRADVFLDLLVGDTTHSRRGRGVVNLTVDLETLARLADRPGDLGGYGPVVAEIARSVADRSGDSGWRYTITDPDSSLPVATGSLRRRPTSAQRRHVEARDGTCVFPGCRMSAVECDIDHRIPHEHDGPTLVDNLVALCRHDHRMRHEHGWTHRALPGGDYLWTSPLGTTYTTSGVPP